MSQKQVRLFLYNLISVNSVITTVTRAELQQILQSKRLNTFKYFLFIIPVFVYQIRELVCENHFRHFIIELES